MSSPPAGRGFLGAALLLIAGAGLGAVARLSFWSSVALAIAAAAVGAAALVVRGRSAWRLVATAALVAVGHAGLARMLWRLEHAEPEPAGKWRTSFIEEDLFETIRALEYLKLTRGEYPVYLVDLEQALGDLGLATDSSAPWSDRDRFHGRFYYTRLAEGGYHLRARGADSEPFTEDDVVPRMPDSDLGRIGYVPLDRNPYAQE